MRNRSLAIFLTAVMTLSQATIVNASELDAASDVSTEDMSLTSVSEVGLEEQEITEVTGSNSGGTSQDLDLSDALLFGGLTPSEIDDDLDSQMFMDDGDGSSIYEVIADGITNQQESIDLSDFGISQEVFEQLNPVVDVLNANPQFFYVEGAELTTDEAGDISELNIRYDADTDRMIREFDAAMGSMIGQVDSSWTDVEKCLFVHDYLVTSIDYDRTFRRYSAYDAVVNHSAVCQGYASAFLYAMRMLGIPVGMITSDGLGHAWNVVNVNGKQYYIDCTWDDPSNIKINQYCSHNFFMLSQDELYNNQHDSTDWKILNSEPEPLDQYVTVYSDTYSDAYNVISTASDLDGMNWREVVTPIILNGREGYYAGEAQGSLALDVRKIDFNTLTESRVCNTESNIYGMGIVFYSCAQKNGEIYASTSDGIYKVSASGYTQVFENSDNNYIYGIININDDIYYDLYTGFGYDTFVARKRLGDGAVYVPTPTTNQEPITNSEPSPTPNTDPSVNADPTSESDPNADPQPSADEPTRLPNGLLLTSPNYTNLSWIYADGLAFWIENNTIQGTIYDPNGVKWRGDTIGRGREIYDGGSDGWYWLDSNRNGAKATGKEVFMPYIYQHESDWSDAEIRKNANASDDGMQDYVYDCIKNGTGKWVRYDENGAMLKGWVKIEGTLAELYPNQAGNTYYYDTKTGLMAKGWIKIKGKKYHFDEQTGVKR